jgi:serine/threonine protein kinase
MKSFSSQKIFNKYYIIDELSSSESFYFYKVKDSSDNPYFLKLFTKGKYDQKLINEIEKGIYINSQEEANSSFVKYVNSESNIKTKTTCIIYEFEEKQTLNDILMMKLFFGERLSLTIFRQIALLVDSLHKIGLTQTNLKLDNILIDANYKLKMAGFSSIQFIQDDNALHNDIFQLAFFLLNLLTGKYYLKKQESKIIKIIKQGKFEFLWKSIEMQNNQTFSKKLKELINKMFESKKNNVDLNEIILIENEWFNDIQVNDNDNYMKNSFKQFEEADKNY